MVFSLYAISSFVCIFDVCCFVFPTQTIPRLAQWNCKLIPWSHCLALVLIYGIFIVRVKNYYQIDAHEQINYDEHAHDDHDHDHGHGHGHGMRASSRLYRVFESF